MAVLFSRPFFRYPPTRCAVLRERMAVLRTCTFLLDRDSAVLRERMAVLDTCLFLLAFALLALKEVPPYRYNHGVVLGKRMVQRTQRDSTSLAPSYANPGTDIACTALVLSPSVLACLEWYQAPISYEVAAAAVQKRVATRARPAVPQYHPRGLSTISVPPLWTQYHISTTIVDCRPVRLVRLAMLIGAEICYADRTSETNTPARVVYYYYAEPYAGMSDQC
eukprot:1233780-Rhodomonas_salina.2